MSDNIWYDRKDVTMSIQIFGTKKCADIRKADRFFKERGIKYQFIDTKEKGMSKAVMMTNSGSFQKMGQRLLDWQRIEMSVLLCLIDMIDSLI